MFGNIYCNDNYIIKEAFGKKIINTIDGNLKLKFGVYSIEIFNQKKIYISRENEKNDIMENIYKYIKNNINQNNLIFPILYKDDNSIISFLYFLFCIIGIIVYVLLKIYNIPNIGIWILLLSLLFFIVAIIVLLLKRNVIFEADKIIIYNLINQKCIVPITDLNKVELNCFLEKLYLFIYYGKKRIRFDLNRKTSFQNILDMCLLEKYYNEQIETIGTSPNKR